jgi:hypothetical protein
MLTQFQCLGKKMAGGVSIAISSALHALGKHDSNIHQEALNTLTRLAENHGQGMLVTPALPSKIRPLFDEVSGQTRLTGGVDLNSSLNLDFDPHCRKHRVCASWQSSFSEN